MSIQRPMQYNVHVSIFLEIIEVPVLDTMPHARRLILRTDISTISAPSQVSKLQRLVGENVDISAADIAAWQNAT